MKIIIRPSGNEPSIRIHAAVHVKDYRSIEEGIIEGDQQLDKILDNIKSELSCV